MDNKWPKVSILVPIYGTERYIARCAESLFQQSYENIEYIFVDDCTKDNSIDVLKSVVKRYPKRETSVKIVRHDSNRGLAAARISALANSTGEYVLHVDSDDFLPVEAVAILVGAAIDGNFDIVGGSFQIYTKGKFGEVVPPVVKRRKTYIKCLISRLGIMYNNIWGNLIRKELYLRNNINAIEGVNFAEDYSVLPKLIYYGRRTAITDVIYYYNVDNAGSYTHNISDSAMISGIQARTEIYSFFCNKKEYKFSAELGMVNIYRVAVENDMLACLKNINFNFVPTYNLLKLYKKALLTKGLSCIVFKSMSLLYKLKSL